MWYRRKARITGLGETGGGVSEQHEGGLSRRAVVRAAGGAVWAAPVIALATAAPAAAVGSPVGSLVVSQAAYSGGVLGVLGPSITATVCNNGTVGFVSPITLTIQVPIGISALPSISGSGWVLTSSLLDLANLGTLTLSWNGTLAAGACAPQVTLQWLLGVNIGSGRTATASGTDTFGHKVTSPSKSF